MNKRIRFPLRPWVLIGMVGLLSLTGCEAKLAQFFGPATELDTGGGGSDLFPTAVDLNQMMVSINYTTISTSCEASHSPFSADADLTTSGSGPVMLNIKFPDAPVAISGVYVVDTGQYTGETGDVDLGSNLFANEQWSVGFMKTSSSITMSGQSTVDVVEVPGSFTCQRLFNITATYNF